MTARKVKQPFWKSVGKFYKKLELDIAYDFTVVKHIPKVIYIPLSRCVLILSTAAIFTISRRLGKTWVFIKEQNEEKYYIFGQLNIVQLLKI